MPVGVAVTAAESGPSPRAFTARTVTARATPARRFSIAQAVAGGSVTQVALASPSSGVAVTSYRSTADPPSAHVPSASHETET